MSASKTDEASPVKIEWKEYTFPSGTTYRGGFAGTRKESRGFWKHPEGESYEGEYHDNKQHGYGIYEFPDTGKRYYGQWEMGQMHGNGVYIFNKDATEFFIGTYQHDQKHGCGLYRYAADGRITEQEWNNGAMVKEEDAAPATQVAYYAKRIEVEWQVERVSRNLVVGVSEKIELQFLKKTEKKAYTFPSGAQYDGHFLGTKKHGQGLWSHPSGDTYEGTFKYNKHEGWGTYKIGKSGKMYVGGWRDGKMDGWGVYYFNEQNSEYFIGTYSNDLKDGQGVYVFASGSTKFQTWERGNMVHEEDCKPLALELHESARSMITEQVMQHTTQFGRDA